MAAFATAGAPRALLLRVLLPPPIATLQEELGGAKASAEELAEAPAALEAAPLQREVDVQKVGACWLSEVAKLQAGRAGAHAGEGARFGGAVRGALYE